MHTTSRSCHNKLAQRNSWETVGTRSMLIDYWQFRPYTNQNEQWMQFVRRNSWRKALDNIYCTNTNKWRHCTRHTNTDFRINEQVAEFRSHGDGTKGTDVLNLFVLGPCSSVWYYLCYVVFVWYGHGWLTCPMSPSTCKKISTRTSSVIRTYFTFYCLVGLR